MQVIGVGEVLNMARNNLGRTLLLTFLLVTLSAPVSAYYYWIFYASGSGPFTPLAARYDLNALEDNTVEYFVSDQAPGPLTPGDNITAIYSEIRQAAAVWNGVTSSALRLHFGGVRDLAIPQTVPGIDVVFDDNIPPGIIAQTRLTFPADLAFLSAKGAASVPILRAKVQLRKDLTAAGYRQPSYSDEFFTTLVHEFGHALGLQHTFTSAAMSTAVTRASTRGIPLEEDDVSGISLLYPAGSYAASTGSLTGQVTAPDGTGINLASVVALSPSGTAISGMTRPDGTYRIDGIPPGQYFVYAHPLPPAQTGEATPANITAPIDPQNDDFSANTKFAAQFFPGTQDWTQAAVIGVAAGKTLGKIDFSVAASPGPVIYGMQTYGYPSGVAIAAPPLVTNTRDALVLYANGITVNNQSVIAPGLNVSVIGGGAAGIEPGSLKYYRDGFLQAAVDTQNVLVNIPVALAVTLNGELYVLPRAFTVVPSAAPAISAVTLQPTSASGVATTVSGTNLTASTRILFEGSPAKVLWSNPDGSLGVAEPPGLSGSQATVEAVNPDGQSSLQSLGPGQRPLFTYPQLNPVRIVSTPYTATAGTDTLMVISGIDTHFAEGDTVIGFGSSDISVRGSWVVGPHMVILSLSVNAGAQPGMTYISAATGLEIVTQVNGMQIVAADPHQISMRVPIRNAVTGLAGIPAGGVALIPTTGLPRDLTGWNLSIGPLNAAFTADKNGLLTVNVPVNLAVGAQPVELTAPGNPPAAIVPRVILQLDPAPPVIVAAVDTPAKSNDPAAPQPAPFAVSAPAPARLGDAVTLTVYGLSASTGHLPAPEAVWVNLAGSVFPVTAIAAVPPDPKAATPPLDFAYVTLVLPKSLVVDATKSSPAVPVMVGTGTRLSAAYALNVTPLPTTP